MGASKKISLKQRKLDISTIWEKLPSALTEVDQLGIRSLGSVRTIVDTESFSVPVSKRTTSHLHRTSRAIAWPWFCQNSVSGQNNIVPHLLRRSAHVLPTLPIYVRIEENARLSGFLLPRLRKAFQWKFRYTVQWSPIPERHRFTRCFLATEI